MRTNPSPSREQLLPGSAIRVGDVVEGNRVTSIVSRTDHSVVARVSDGGSIVVGATATVRIVR